jgi:hypothetical protein
LMAHDLMDSVRRVIDVLMSLVQWRLLVDDLARRLCDWRWSKVVKRSRLHDSGRGSKMPTPRWAVLDESRVWKDTEDAIKGWSDSEGKSGYLQLFRLSESPKAETSINDVLLGLWDRLSKLALAMFNWEDWNSDSRSKPLESVPELFQSLFLALVSRPKTECLVLAHSSDSRLLNEEGMMGRLGRR